MNEMPSAEFRKRYAKLKEPTVVTVNGHAIGAWMPVVTDAQGREYGRPITASYQAIPAQAARDDLLRKINRGKG